MTTLREKMKHEMILIGLADSTQKCYLKSIIKLYEYYKQSPATLSASQIRNYLLHLKNKSLQPNTYNLVIHALRFFYCITLNRPLMKLELPTTRISYKLPDILSPEEVQRILKATGNRKHKTLLIVIYGAGLRVSEAVNLRMKDIDSLRMTLHIRDCKNRKDRYVILSKIVYQHLRAYWRCAKFTDYVFPGKAPEKPITTSAVSAIYQQGKHRANIKKAGGIHALRHAFATHMLENGDNIFTIKVLLGHSSIQSTARYLRFIPGKNTTVKLPIDDLNI